jgi:hypothetical protein
MNNKVAGGITVDLEGLSQIHSQGNTILIVEEFEGLASPAGSVVRPGMSIFLTSPLFQGLKNSESLV